ncbi:hypothetical protein L9F63_007095 [Diploptera punctata]|uniref:Protein SMG5 n=1 Tax=Diploptera punctata TaxID=6984 RepID=A0AAD8E3L5_DIPPU|nr:hypothetical protein L9F63_007095 [Diploptera punctata]
MKKSYNPISDVRNENVELTRRLYRAISDASRHLDDRRGRAQTCSDLFLPNLEAQRVKLREYCERLIFSDPVGYGRKGEELLWRKGYYDVVTTAKRLRKNNIWSPMEIAYMQGHLLAGIGQYHHLLFRLQTEYKLDLRGYVDFPLLFSDSGLMKDKSSSSKALDNNCVDWAKQAAHRCLVYLGDLYRYVMDLHPRWDTGLAVRYYLQALHLNVDIGMPHNQLGTLSGTRNYGLDAAYHYMRWYNELANEQPFEGAEGNLQRLLERNLQWSELNLKSQNHRIENAVSQNPAEHVHQLISRFLLLIDCWFFDRKSPVEIHQVCHQMLLDLQLCLGYSKPFSINEECELKGGEQVDLENVSVFQASEEDLENPEYLKEDLICKMVVMSLLCVSKLQSNVDRAKSLVVKNKFKSMNFDIPDELKKLESAWELRSMRSTIHDLVTKFETTGSVQNKKHTRRQSNFIPVNSCEDSNKITDNVNSNQNLSSNIEFPYGAESSSSDDQNSDISENTEPDLDLSSDEDEDDDDEDDEDEDEEEEDGISNMAEKKADNSKINVKETTETKSLKQDNVIEEQCNGSLSDDKSDTVIVNGLKSEDTSSSLILSNNSSNDFETALSKVGSSEEKDTDKGSVKKNDGLDPADLLELVADEGLLDAIKICADWLHGDSDIIKACGQSSRTLLSRFITMLNLINVDAEAFQNGREVGHFFKLRNIQEVFKKIPLPEDVMLKGLPVLKSVHESIDWEYLRHHSLHAKEEALLRVYKLVDFGQFLVSIPDIGVKYDSKQKLFTVANETEEGSAEEKLDQPSPTNEPEENNSNTIQNVGLATNRNSNARKGQLMHHMGQLWLRAEVNDLESRVRRRGATFSPYLAVDSDALINYIHLVKQLVGARKFIILIPSIVVSALDELKREIGKARETIRWLESQFQRGNRFLRAQRSHERLQLPLMKYPKKKDKEAWLFFQVVECCHYFSQQTGIHETHPESALVTLLTGYKSSAKEESTKGFSPLGVAKSAGINLEHIETFHAKWKTSSKSHG